MKNKATILVVLSLVSVSFVIAGCPRHVRPHVPHRPHIPRPLQSMDLIPQLERQSNAVMASTLGAEESARHE